MYIVKFNKDTSKAWREDPISNWCFVSMVEKWCITKLRMEGSIELQTILNMLGIHEDCPNKTFIASGRNSYIDFGLDNENIFDKNNELKDEFTLHINLY
jgi:hypothetical protein